jgi:hypothetical protein
MASFRFTGDPRHGGEGPDDITLLGHRFDRRHATDVSDAGVIAKLAGNPHFVQIEAEAVPPREAVVQVPSQQMRPRKSRRKAQGAA